LLIAHKLQPKNPAISDFLYINFEELAKTVLVQKNVLNALNFYTTFMAA
jgi:hypothetical protein